MQALAQLLLLVGVGWILWYMTLVLAPKYAALVKIAVAFACLVCICEIFIAIVEWAKGIVEWARGVDWSAMGLIKAIGKAIGEGLKGGL